MVGTRLMSVARVPESSGIPKVGSNRRTMTCFRAEHGGSLGTAPAIGVEQRNGVQIHHALDILEHAGDRRARASTASDATSHALGRAGAAAGVEQLRDGVLVVGENIRALGVPAVQQFHAVRSATATFSSSVT